MKLSKKQALVLAWSLAWEGSIGVRRQKDPTAKLGWFLRPRFDIYNTDRELLEKFREFIGGYGRIFIQRYNDKPLWKPCYRWTIQRQDECLELLKEIIDLLPSKRRQAELLLEFLELRKAKKPYSDREIQIAEELHKLNKRGLH